MKKIVMMVLVSLFLVGTASTAKAIVITPGTFNATPTYVGTPDYGSGLNSVTGVLASVTYSYNYGSGPILGTISEYVYRNSAGNILFAFDANRNSTASSTSDKNYIVSLGNSDYTGFTTDVGYTDTTGVAPDLVSRITASNVTYTWLNSFTTGTTSDRLLIQTNAQYWDPGKFSVQSGGEVQGFTGFQPSAVPEPATASLLGMGLFGLLGFRRKKQA